MNIDWVIRCLKSEGYRDELSERYRDIYPLRRYLIVIIFPSATELVMESQWTEVYEALSELRNINIDANIFLRFRFLDEPSLSMKIEMFKGIAEKDKRFILDHANFTTYELMAICDLFIACNASFGINEAVAAGTKVFTFDYTGFAKCWFTDYGKDFVLSNRSDLLRVFRGLESGFDGFDCKWELLKKDLNYHYDGRNLERIQKVVLDTIKEKEQGKGESRLSVAVREESETYV
jgi:hypothetical protein